MAETHYGSITLPDGAVRRPLLPDHERVQDPGCCSRTLIVLAWILTILTFPITLCFTLKIVQEFERAVIFRLGRALPEPKGPGLFFILPFVDSMVKIDMRTVAYNVPPQEILTKDSVTVTVDAVVYYRINRPWQSVINIKNAASSTKLLAMTTLRNMMGMRTLTQILSERDDTSQQMQQILDNGTKTWGIKVERVEVKDVHLPRMMQRAMAAEAEAGREARAKVIAAEGERSSSRPLKEAADVLSEAPSALQLRFLQTLTSVSAEKNSTVVFPVPVDLLKGLRK